MDVRNGEMDVLIERISNSLWTVSHITVISLFFLSHHKELDNSFALML